MLKTYFYRLFFISFFTLFSVVSHAFAIQAGQPITLNNSQLDQYLQKKVGTEDTYAVPHLLSVNYKVLSLHGKIGNTPDRVQLYGVFLADMDAQGINSKGKITLKVEFKPDYFSNDGTFYFRNFKVLKWDSSSKQQRTQLKFLMPVIENIAKTSLSILPVYTLNENDPHQALVKQLVTKVEVKPGKLLFYTNLTKAK